jgi:hypothetical protein
MALTAGGDQVISTVGKVGDLVRQGQADKLQVNTEIIKSLSTHAITRGNRHVRTPLIVVGSAGIEG